MIKKYKKADITTIEKEAIMVDHNTQPNQKSKNEYLNLSIKKLIDILIFAAVSFYHS